MWEKHVNDDYVFCEHSVQKITLEIIKISRTLVLLCTSATICSKLLVFSLFIVFWSFLLSSKKDLCRKCAKNIYKQDAGRGPPWATVESPGTDAEIYHPCNCLGFLGNCPELLTIRPNGGSCSSLPLYFHPDSIECTIEDQAYYTSV
jgi:hypothetical protein